MSPVLAFLIDHSVSVLIGLSIIVWLSVRLLQSRRPWQAPLFSPLLALSALLIVIGGASLPKPLPIDWEYFVPIGRDASGWLMIGSGLGTIIASLVLVLSGRWSRTLGILLLAVGMLGAGGQFLKVIQSAFSESWAIVRSLEVVQPGWLLLLLTLPIWVRMSYRSLAGLGPVRRWLAMGIRLGLVTLLVFALAEVRIRRPNENVTVLYLVDRSLSIPQEIDPRRQNSSGEPVDGRWLRLQQFINEAVHQRGLDHRNDQSGVVLFSRRPRLVMPPSAVNQLLVGEQMAGVIDTNYTDIAAALKLGLASFPEGTGKRIVLISDGNENLGNAEEQANLAKQNGVQIDTVLVAAGYRNENEVLIQSVEAPPITALGSRLPPIRVLVRNTNPTKVVLGTLELLQVRDGRERPVSILDGIGVLDRQRIPALVKLRPGLNSFSFRDAQEERAPKPDEVLSFTYRAQFTPLESANENGENAVAGLPGDRVQNNKASTHVVARGQRRVLFLEAEPDVNGQWTHQHLIDRLRQARFQVAPLNVGKIPQNPADFAVFLSNYDCVIVPNIPYEVMSKEQWELIRANTFDQGCGLVVVGGPDSYGAGGYQDTPIEKALPVDCQIKALKAAGKGGLVLIMHASEMADGNRWQKEIAKLAIKKLSPIDMVGMIYYGFNTQWYIPFQTVGEDRGRLLSLIDRMTPGDMPDFDPGLGMAYETLSDPQHELVTKHVIIISDGDASLGAPGQTSLQKMSENRITCTTVGVATHGAAETTRMQQIATTTKGKFYNVTDPSKLPAIYIKEARRVSQSFLYDRKFTPKLVQRGGPTDQLAEQLPDLFGFIRTTKKDSPLAEMLIEGPAVFEQRFPILATWQYGLGRSAAFTSDARSLPPNVAGWDRDWAASEMYFKFWEQVVSWAMRGVETGKLIMQSEYRDGKVRITIDARDDRNRPITDLKLEGGVTPPGGIAANGKPIIVNFEQKSGGIYEAEFTAEEAGSYFMNAVAKRDGQIIDSVRAGITLPYSPEFADLESNTALLRRLSTITGGNVYNEDSESLRELASSGALYRAAPSGTRSQQPIWYWLVFLAGVGLLIDVGVRRISIEPAEVRYYANRLWTRLRHREVKAESSATLSRLMERKSKAAERIDRGKATRKFEAGELLSGSGPPPGADDAPAAPSVLPPKPPPAPPRDSSASAPESTFERLKRAKKRAQQQRDSQNDDSEDDKS